MKLPSTAMLATIIASLVAVPVASANLTDHYESAVESFGSQNPNSTEPFELEQTTSPDENKIKLETPKGTLVKQESSTNTISKLENHEHKLRKETRSDREELIYRNQEAKLRTVEKPVTTERICKTAEGELEKIKELGETTTRFHGEELEKVEDICQEVSETKEEAITELHNIKIENGIKDVKEDLKISDYNLTKEKIVLKNSGDIEIDLEGWTLNKSETWYHTFEEGTLAPGETVEVLSGEAEDDCEEIPGETICWLTTPIWSSDGDSARLYDPEDNLVENKTMEG